MTKKSEAARQKVQAPPPFFYEKIKLLIHIMERGKEEMKKRRRILSLFSAACLAITGIVSGAGVQKAEAAARTEVIDVTDYGVYPDSGKDAMISIQIKQ